MSASGEPEGQLSFLAPIDVRVRVQNVYGELLMNGCVNTRVGLACARCLKSVSLIINSSFSQVFHYRASGCLPPSPTEEKASEQEAEIICFNGDHVIIDDIVRQAIHLSLPMRLLCRSGCKGLCPICGCDLNLQECNCCEERVDPRLAVLEELLRPRN